MLRAHRATTPVETAWRLLTPLLAITLVLSVDAALPASVEAGGVGSASVAIRQRQSQAEASMLRADQQIKRLQRSRRQHAQRLATAKRKLDQAIARRDDKRERLERTIARVERADRVLARVVRVRPNPRGTQIVDRPAARKQIRSLERKVRLLGQQARTLEGKVERARKVKQARLKKVGRARIEARRSARERAEDRLAAAIGQMLVLSRERAGERLSPATVKGFRRPVQGSISQRYGCTGYGANPRRGGCRHFHDGVDIAASRGTPVRASADGYVAYVGRNPWDVGSRAFVVIMVHAGGYESVYAHLQPKRLVRAGTQVRRGEVVGRVGITGRSSGPHVHWEVRRGLRSVDPLRAGRSHS